MGGEGGRSSQLDAVQTLQALEALRNLKARHVRFLDTKDRDGWTQVRAPQIDAGPGAPG